MIFGVCRLNHESGEGFFLAVSGRGSDQDRPIGLKPTGNLVTVRSIAAARRLPPRWRPGPGHWQAAAPLAHSGSKSALLFLCSAPSLARSLGHFQLELEVYSGLPPSEPAVESPSPSVDTPLPGRDPGVASAVAGSRFLSSPLLSQAPSLQIRTPPSLASQSKVGTGIHRPGDPLASRWH
jgi:hypothetical protein